MDIEMWSSELRWINPPALAVIESNVLKVVTGTKGDFWRDTFYGFRHDDGHAFLSPTGTEFSCEVFLSADFAAQYDQAGLMIRADEAHWIKAGIEYVNGIAHLATVVTNQKSDWSQMALLNFDGEIGLRLTRVGDAVWMHYQASGSGNWNMFRLAYFPPNLAVRAGPMACSPSRSGLTVKFWDFRLGAPESRKPY